MPYNEAMKRAQAKYRKEKRERIGLELPRGTKTKIHILATKSGESMQGYILKAVKERAARDGMAWESIGAADIGGADDTESGGDM